MSLKAACLDVLSYHEVWELFRFGATVLHQTTFSICSQNAISDVHLTHRCQRRCAWTH